MVRSTRWARLRGGEWLLLALLSFAVVGLAGCHHTTRAYQPPVAPNYPAPPAAKHGTEQADAGTVQEIPRNATLISTEIGLASWYGPNYNYMRAANGEVYEQEGMSAASRTLPLGAIARVTNIATGDVAVVRITDRGPFVPGRILDLSLGGARAVGLYRAGVAQVKVEAYEPEGAVVPPAKWCVQIGAFLDPDDATQMKNDLIRKYGASKVISFKGPTGSWVRLTPTSSDKALVTQVAAGVLVPDPGVAAYVTRIN